MKLSALIIGAVGIVLLTFFYFIVGYRGRGLVYCALIILFTGFCIWGVINWDEFTAMLESKLGVWGMSGVVLLIALAVWFCIHVLF